MPKSFLKVISENLLFIFLILGVVLGFVLGLFLNDKVQQSTEFTPRAVAMFIGFPGELFLRMLMLVVLPLITSSVISSLTIIDRNTAGKIGKRAAVYFLITALIASSMAIILGDVMIKPRGREIHEEDTKTKAGSSPVYAILDMLRNMVPDNILEAGISSTGTELEKKVTDFKLVNKSVVGLHLSAKNLTSFLKRETIIPWSVSADSVQVVKEQNVVYEYAGLEKYPSPNVLGVLVFSVFFGMILSGLGEEGKPIVDWFRCLFKVIMKMVDILIWFSPIGVSSIIASKLVAMQDIGGTVQNLGLFIAALIIGSIVYGFIIIPAIYLLLLRKNPFSLMSCVSKALMTAIGTSSSSATIPITLSCFEKKKVANKRLAQFLLPIGTAVNVPGTVIYIAISAIFVLQTFHPNLINFTTYILICLTSPIATLAAPPIAAATPLVVQSIVLQVLGIPTADIGLIVAIDWFIDRFATPVNIWSNCTACVIIEHYSRKELQSFDDITKPDDEECISEASETNTIVNIGIANEVEVTIETKDNKEDITLRNLNT